MSKSESCYSVRHNSWIRRGKFNISFHFHFTLSALFTEPKRLFDHTIEFSGSGDKKEDQQDSERGKLCAKRILFTKPQCGAWCYLLLILMCLNSQTPMMEPFLLCFSFFAFRVTFLFIASKHWYISERASFCEDLKSITVWFPVFCHLVFLQNVIAASK